MPCLYAHYAFGREIRKEVPKEIQDCIDTYRDAFDWGLQGPDFLFFYHLPGRKIIQKMGKKIHQKSIAAYINKMLPQFQKKGIDSPETAYLMGFLCHYMLDSQCHPYVNFWKEQGYPHSDTEKAFDQYLMRMDGKIPARERLYRYLPLSKEAFYSVAFSYPWMQKRHLFLSMISFVGAKKFFYAPHIWKRKLLSFTTRKLRVYRKLNRHYYWEEMPKRFAQTNTRLHLLYCEALEQTVDLIENIWNAIKEEEEVLYTERMLLDFGGLRIR